MVFGRGGAFARRPGGRPCPTWDDGSLTQSAVAKPTAEAARQRDLQVEQPSTSHLQCTAVSDETFKTVAVHQGGGSSQNEMEARQRAAITSSSEPLLSSHIPAGEASQPRERELKDSAAHRSCRQSHSSDDDVVMTERQGVHASGAGGPSGGKSFGPGDRGESVRSGDGEGALERGDCGGTPEGAERNEGQSCGAGEEKEEEEKQEEEVVVVEEEEACNKDTTVCSPGDIKSVGATQVGKIRPAVERDVSAPVANASTPSARQKSIEKGNLTHEDVLEIFKKRPMDRYAYGGPSSCEVADVYGVNQKTIRDVWNRKTWVKSTRPYWSEAEEEAHSAAKGLNGARVAGKNTGISVRSENANSLRGSGESDAKQHEDEAEKLHQPDEAAATSPSNASEAYNSSAAQGHSDGRDEDEVVEGAMGSARGGDACTAGVGSSPRGGMDVHKGIASWSGESVCETFYKCCYDCRFGPIPRGEKNRPSVAKCRVSKKHTGKDWNVDLRYLEEELIRKEGKEYREYWEGIKSAKKGGGSKCKAKGKGSTQQKGEGSNGRRVDGQGEGSTQQQGGGSNGRRLDGEGEGGEGAGAKRKGSTTHEKHGKRARNELESQKIVHVDLGMLKDPSLCPISGKPLSRPVFCTADGASYDKHAISDYLKKCGGVLPGGALAKDGDMVQDKGMAQCVAEILGLRQKDYVDRKRARELEDEVDDAIAKRDALRNRVEEAERMIASFERAGGEGETNLDMLALAAEAARKEQRMPSGEENPTGAGTHRRKETLGKVVPSEVSGWVAVAAAPPPATSGQQVAAVDVGETDALKSEIGSLKHQMYSLTQTLSHVLNQRGGGALHLNQQVPVQASNYSFLSNLVGHLAAAGNQHNAALVDRGNLHR